MDALKVAFDTLIVGALALPWLGVLLRMYFPADRKDGYSNLVSALPEHTREAVLSVVILSLGYVLGAAVSRISDDFFGDTDMWALPSEASIRTDVYFHEYCHNKVNVVEAITLPKQIAGPEVAFCTIGAKNTKDEKVSRAIEQFFRLQESKLLLQGDDRTSRLRQLHDQSVILRGATLNGLALFVLTFFGFCASFHGGFRQWRQFALPSVIAGLLIV